MSLELEKKVEKVKLRLEKMGVPASVIARVIFMLDCSGSAAPLYRSGTMGTLTDRLLPLGMRFDDNGAIEMYGFSDSAAEMDDVTAADFGSYINKKFIPQANSSGIWMNGTDWASPAKLMLSKGGSIQTPAPSVASGAISKFKGLFGSKPAAPAAVEKVIPAFIFFVTDGRNYGNQAEFERIIAGTPIAYWKLIGVGHDDFSQLEYLADKYDNVGFSNFENLAAETDDSIYEDLLDVEATAFLKRFA